MIISRYEESQSIKTNLDPLSDLIGWLEYYAALDYVVSLLTSRHGFAAPMAKSLAGEVRAHARLAREYIDQALSGPTDVAFLPMYYAILNLLKICILFGPHHALLASNRWHGATYDGFSKDSQTLLTEEITVKKGGALPLFYETITGRRITRDTSLALSEVYPYLWDVSIEYEMASGRPSRIAEFECAVVAVTGGHQLRVNVAVQTGMTVPKAGQLKALRGFSKDPKNPWVFVSKLIPGRVATAAQIRVQLRPWLLYQQLDGVPGCRICGSPFVFPEEFPIALAFFHLSSVVRYKPEFLARLKDSKYWPVLSTARRHCLLKFLMTFWEFTHKKTLVISQA